MAARPRLFLVLGYTVVALGGAVWAWSGGGGYAILMVTACSVGARLLWDRIGRRRPQAPR